MHINQSHQRYSIILRQTNISIRDAISACNTSWKEPWKCPPDGIDEIFLSSTIATNPRHRIDTCEHLLQHIQDIPPLLVGYRHPGYSFKEDLILMPRIDRFDTPQEYYASYFHELIHSTGHQSRLNRPEAALYWHPRPRYHAIEEMTAEFGSLYLSAICGILQTTLQNSSAYINHYLQKTTHHPTALYQASTNARNAIEYLLL